VFGEGAQVERVTCEHDCIRLCASKSSHDRVDGRDGPGAAGCSAEAGCFARLNVVDRTDLAGAQQIVSVKVATVVAGQRFGQGRSCDLPATALADVVPRDGLADQPRR